jgi:hypothetical protein
MSRKIIHLTAGYGKDAPVAVHANSIAWIEEIDDAPWKTGVHFSVGAFSVRESYPTVLRLWADALASED